jgi:uncharacterized protein YggE
MKTIMVGAAALMAGAAVAQPAPTAALGPNATLLSLSAEGQSLRRPDLAMFSAGVVSQARTAGEAMSANAERMADVMAALRRAGVAERDIQTSNLSLNPRFSDPERERMIAARTSRQPYEPSPHPEPPRIIGYEARNSVAVRSRDLKNLARVIDALVTAGANEVNGPSFALDKPEDALDEARREAVAKARARAELYARAAGLRVVRIASIVEGGGFYPVQREIVVTGSSVGAPPPPAPPPVAAGELMLGVTLSMQFVLER